MKKAILIASACALGICTACIANSCSSETTETKKRIVRNKAIYRTHRIRAPKPLCIPRLVRQNRERKRCGFST